jgi:AraC family transcriptional regulator, arabinose operon regulatory protein
MKIIGAKSLHPANHHFRRPPGFALWTFWTVYEGASNFIAGGVKLVCQSRHSFLLPPNHPYEMPHGFNKEPWLETYVLFDPPPEWLPLLEWPSSPVGLRSLDFTASPRAWNHYSQSLAILEETFLLPTEAGMPYRKNAFERVLLVANLYNPGAQATRRDQRIKDTIRHLSENLEKPASIASLAKRAHLSGPRFAQLFKQETGASVMQFLETQRIARARELLVTTNLPIKQIAHLCGFENPFHFSTRFKRLTHQTPRGYRLLPESTQ